MKRGGPLRRKTRLRAKSWSFSKVLDPHDWSAKPSRNALARSKPPARAKPLAKLGKRGREAQAALRKSHAIVRVRSGGWCEEPGCTKRAQDFDHIQRRSRRPGWSGLHEPENLRHLCRPHHDEKTFG